MRLTPLDIHHKEFSHALRGYNEVEVDEFLDQVADELERLFKENIDLSEKIEGLELKVREYQDMERTLHNTLLSAQKSADEIAQKAEREADAVLKEAEVKAKEIIHDALTSKQKATADLGRIKQAEEEFRGTFKALLERQLRAIGEVSLPDDVLLMVGKAGDETLLDAEVGRRAVPAEVAPRPVAEPEPSAPTPEPQRTPEPKAAPSEVPSSGFVASLQLGDLGEDVLEPDATVEFNVAEFGFGEREDDTDIEEID
ncbi:MAG: DivIVA domain-containing protein [Coriobacteriia bacterium]|nr:DivIVA domain-containing protein [Coriobacteriia bacterium]MBN2841107.1 DivIVA domain-containing protein [Coriobacteriia bacterium]